MEVNKMAKPPIEMRIKHILEYTKQKETLAQASILFRTINTVLRHEGSKKLPLGEWRTKNYKTKIYTDEEPKDVDFRAYDDIDAVVQTLDFLERFDGIGFRLERKKLLLRTLVKETYPDCGLINAHGYDSNRPCFTRESKALQETLKRRKGNGDSRVV